MRNSVPSSPPPFHIVASQTGVSSAALGLHEQWRTIFHEIVSSIAMGAQYRRLCGDLTHLGSFARVANWDGHGALPLDQQALAYATRIANMLPVTEPAPEVSVDPDGEVSFDWHRNSKRTLSMSIGREGKMRYASIMGESESFGVEPWRDEIPESIRRVLEEVVRSDGPR